MRATPGVRIVQREIDVDMPKPARGRNEKRMTPTTKDAPLFGLGQRYACTLVKQPSLFKAVLNHAAPFDVSSPLKWLSLRAFEKVPMTVSVAVCVLRIHRSFRHGGPLLCPGVQPRAEGGR
jgi:hypothetical protein